MGATVIATPQLSDPAIVIAGTATAGSMPVTNLQTQQPSDTARWAQPTNPQIIYNLGSAQQINLVMLGYTNASVNATWRVRAASTQAGLTSGPGYDSGTVGFWPDASVWWWDRVHGYLWFGSSPKTFQWWQIDVTDSSNPQGYFQAGRCYICNAYQAVRAAKLGGDLSIDETVPTSSTSSAHVQTGGGQKYPSVRVKTGRQKFTLDLISKAEALGTVYQIARLRGATADVWAILDPDDRTYFMQQQAYGTLKAGQMFKYTQENTSGVLYSLDFEIEELP